MQQTVNLKEKTLEELKAMGWDLRILIDNDSKVLQAIVAEIGARQQEQPKPEEPEP